MKKSIFGKAVALLAAGAMAFTAIGCDTGDDSYLPEVPTTYKAMDDAFTGNPNVTAKWSFESLNRDGGTDPVWGIPLANEEKTYTDKTMVQADKATPVGASLLLNGAWVANAKVFQASKKTSTLTGLATAGGSMTLTLKEQANIVVKAKGAGAAEQARYIAITDAADKLLAYKEGLGSDKDVLFVVKGAAAGTYKIYNNGSAIYYVDCSMSNNNEELRKPAEITLLQIWYGSEEAVESELPAIEANVDSLQFSAKNVVNGTSEDLTGDAIWTSSNESVAKVSKGKVTGIAAGKATIRARIGRFYAQKTVTVTPCTKALVTVLAKANLPAAAVQAHTKVDGDATPVPLTDAEKTAFFANAAVKKAFTPVVVNESWITKATEATLELEQFGFDAEMPLGIQPKDETGSAAGGKFGLAWKDGKDGVCSTDKGKGAIAEGWKLATIKFKVTTSKKLKLVKASGYLANGKNANDTILKLHVGNSVADLKTDSGAKTISEYSAKPDLIVEAGEREIEVDVYTCRNGNSFALQEVQLAFEDVLD